MVTFFCKQIWRSLSEPDLGPGEILSMDHRRVTLCFSEGEQRIYNKENAPLERVELHSGDKISLQQGSKITIEESKHVDGLYYYRYQEDWVCENLLDFSTWEIGSHQTYHFTSVEKPQEQLLALEAWNFQQIQEHHPLAGLQGARIELLPHQMATVLKILGKNHKRALLADEVGLGKTIQAALLFYNLYITRKIQRALILVPDALIHQWLVEFYRKYHLLFHITDASFFKEETEVPWLRDSFHICPFSLFENNLNATSSVKIAHWDMIIVDEAHQMAQFPQLFQTIEGLCKNTPHVLFLTATPQHWQHQNNHPLLKLLSENEFSDISKTETIFLKDTLLSKAEKILSNHWEKSKKIEWLENHFTDTEFLSWLSRWKQDKKGAKEELHQFLESKHSLSRIMIRNPQQVLPDLPPRIHHPIELESSPEWQTTLQVVLENLKPEILLHSMDPMEWRGIQLSHPSPELEKSIESLQEKDPRLNWMVQFLKNLPPEEKVLLICHRFEILERLKTLLPKFIRFPFVEFHEGMDLYARDRSAAEFTQDSGSRLLLCTEMGTEGRNFQIASHLILWDLPPVPALLVQRIGRLHRIGQKRQVNLYPLTIHHTPNHHLYRWYHEGLGCFKQNSLGAEVIHTQKLPKIQHLFRWPYTSLTNKDFETLIAEARAELLQYESLSQESQDVFLQMRPHQKEKALALIETIHTENSKSDLERFLERVCETYGLEWHSTVFARTYQIQATSSMTVTDFPEIDPAGWSVTFSRDIALVREEIAFFTWDHPWIHRLLDWLRDRNSGTQVMANWPTAPEKGIYLLMAFRLEDHGATSEKLSLKLINFQGEDKSHWLSHLHRSFLKYPSHQIKNQWMKQKEKMIPTLEMHLEKNLKELGPHASIYSVMLLFADK